jgi:hypothetical protein
MENCDYISFGQIACGWALSMSSSYLSAHSIEKEFLKQVA